jgi:hypothetical protein
MASHAAVPCAETLDRWVVRVHFSSRDSSHRAHVGWVDVDLRKPNKPLRVAEQPELGPGQPGFFDDSGAMLTWITHAGDHSRFYYQGWNVGRTVPFRNAIGLALRDNGSALRRYSAGPILDRGIHDPSFVATPCVLCARGCWCMWYLSCVEWAPTPSGLRHRYHIKFADSDDGIDWRRDGRVCIDFRDDSEYAISRPSVLFDGDLFRMWYSYRGEAYRIGYAVSRDGLSWERRDEESGIDVSPGGWDSHMIEYPHVFDHGSNRYLLYNGNDYGRDGFGLAILEQD